MAAPFIALDGPDHTGQRAEVRVQVGTGTITVVHGRNRAASKNVNLEIESSLAAVRKPIKCWLDKSDPVYAAVIAAHETGREVAYRVENQRKRSVDRTIGIEALRTDADGKPDQDIASANTIVVLAALDGVLTAEALTDPAEDPAAGGRTRAVDRRPAPSGSPASMVTGPAAVSAETALGALAAARTAGLDEVTIGAASALALLAGASPAQVAAAGFTEQPTPPVRQPRAAFAAEAAPHMPVNTDGRDNLGSYRVQGAFAAEHFAVTLLREASQNAFEQWNSGVAEGSIDGAPLAAPRPVDLGQALGLARIFLDMADRVQVGAYGGGRANRMANSHTRARALVFDAIRYRHPLPFGVSGEERDAWFAAVVEEGTERFQALVALAMETPNSGTQSVGAAAGPQVTQATPAASEASEAVDATQATHPAGPEQAPASPAITQPTVITSRKPGAPPVEGQEGFAAPAADVLQALSDLALRAGYTPSPGGPVQTYLMAKFGVGMARQVHGKALADQVGWFLRQADPVATFRAYVDREVTAAGADLPRTA